MNFVIFTLLMCVVSWSFVTCLPSHSHCKGGDSKGNTRPAKDTEDSCGESTGNTSPAKDTKDSCSAPPKPKGSSQAGKLYPYPQQSAPPSGYNIDGYDPIQSSQSQANYGNHDPGLLDTDGDGSDTEEITRTARTRRLDVLGDFTPSKSKAQFQENRLQNIATGNECPDSPGHKRTQLK